MKHSAGVLEAELGCAKRLARTAVITPKQASAKQACGRLARGIEWMLGAAIAAFVLQVSALVLFG